MTVQPSQRFTRRNPCPVCGGGADLARGRAERCHGFAAEDGRFAHCSREERAGGLDPDTAGTYPHRLDGPCLCGITHDEGPPAPPAERRSMPGPARPPLPDRPVPLQTCARRASGRRKPTHGWTRLARSGSRPSATST